MSSKMDCRRRSSALPSAFHGRQRSSPACLSLGVNVKNIFSWAALLVALPALAQNPALTAQLDGQLQPLVSIYKKIHAAPELSHHEENTSALLAGELRSLGYTVWDHVGKYPNGRWQGYGVVGVLKNGKGPTVLVRTDMDALPVKEQTGLPYASNVRAADDSGTEVR